MRRGLLAALAVVSAAALLLLTAATAQASSFMLAFPSFGGGKASLLLNGDERHNDFRIEVVDGGKTVVFRDRGQSKFTLSAPAAQRCEGEGTATVSCPRSTFYRPLRIQLEVGAGDSFDIGARGCRGGEGFSLFNTGAVGAEVWGTASADHLSAAKGARVHGCGGNDWVYVSRSRFDGGPGQDDITASKGSAVSGGGGKDQFKVTTGAKARGGGGGDVMIDGKGSSKLSGGGGNDHLYSGKGRDKLSGGGGKDDINVGSRYRQLNDAPPTYREKPTQPDRVSCGPGKDKAVASHKAPVRGCERVTWLPRTVLIY